MMNKLYTVPEFKGLLLFVRSTYALATSYRWQDAVGVKHKVHQAEGGEHLAIHDALVGEGRAHRRGGLVRISG